MRILKRPIVTEKSMGKSRDGEYVFEVEKSANKNQIRNEVESLFKVKVLRVKTIVVKGKTKRSGKTRQQTKKSDWKKAFIQVGKDQKIDIFPTT